MKVTKKLSLAIVSAALLMGGVTVAIASPGETAKNKAKTDISAKRETKLTRNQSDRVSNASASEKLAEQDSTNHGHCVSWVAHQAKRDGIEGSDRGRVIAAVAANKSAVSTKAKDDESPSEDCASAYEDARAAQGAEPTASSENRSAKSMRDRNQKSNKTDSPSDE